jgi:hypothetical protein
MRDHLLDLVEHTYDLGCIDLVKITGDDKTTVIDGLAEDRSVVVQAAFKQPVSEFYGTFGMPNLSKLKVLLGLEPYKVDADISIKSQERNGAEVPVGLHFKNQAGDFKNDYRFMTSEIIEEKLKVVKFKGVEWNIEFEPTIAGVQRLKYQAMANAEELTFNAMSDGNDLKLEFGDHSTHAGSFIFQPDVNGKLSRTWSWPIKQFISILDLTGDKTVHISDQGAAQITVDSGLAVYQYILPAQSK